MTTNLGKGKIWVLTYLIPLKNWPVSLPVLGEGLVNTYSLVS